MYPLEEHDCKKFGFIIDSHFEEHLVAKIMCSECILLNGFQSSNLNDDSKD